MLTEERVKSEEPEKADYNFVMRFTLRD